MQDNDKFTLTRCKYDSTTNTTEDLWTMENLTTTELTNLMKGRSDQELEAQYDIIKNDGLPYIEVNTEPKYWN